MEANHEPIWLAHGRNSRNKSSKHPNPTGMDQAAVPNVPSYKRSADQHRAVEGPTCPARNVTNKMEWKKSTNLFGFTMFEIVERDVESWKIGLILIQDGSGKVSPCNGPRAAHRVTDRPTLPLATTQRMTEFEPTNNRFHSTMVARVGINRESTRNDQVFDPNACMKRLRFDASARTIAPPTSSL